MSSAEIGLAVSVFVACLVEAVEALTIVLAVGTTRGWPSAMSGAGTAGLVLAAIVAILGAAVARLPLGGLRVVVGGLLLVFGLQWLRKAILRSAGVKAKHDERLIYRRELDAARDAGVGASGFDGYAFVVSFKGVLLEGLEVAFIVVTFGANQHRVPLAAAAAGIAVLLVIAAAVAARAPLARVPENPMKFSVGVLLTSFGMFWGAEGVGARWPGGETSLPAVVFGVLLIAVVLARRAGAVTRPAPRDVEATHTEHVDVPTRRAHLNCAIEKLVVVWEFVAGDDWQTAVGVVLALALTALLADAIGSTWWVIAVAVTGLLARSILHSTRTACGAEGSS
jgi:uncharacterized membrane protein